MVFVNTVEISCITCGVSFWISQNHQAELKKTHKSFYCPNGHTQYYPGKTDAEKYKELFEREQRLRKNIDTDNNSLKNSLRTYKGEVTKLKKKIEGDA